MEFEPKLYNPAAQPEEWLIEHFVVRTKVFERIFDDLKTGDMKHPEQHYLVQGQRGMGKTTLLLRLKYEVERTAGLKEWLMPIFFTEESYDLTSLAALWEKLLKYFDDHLPDGGGYYRETDKYMDRDDYEQLCFDLVLRILRQHKKKIVILFDNFGELFLDNLDEKESHRFREILMTCAEIRIIAASAVVLESHNDYSEPFFDFFKIINLKGLNKTETVELINKLQEKSNADLNVTANKARIETLAVLTGGVIRTIMMLYEILLNDQDGSALKDLERILDKVTPLYKHRMEDLKPQQRRIMDVIAKNWDAMSAREISENIRENGKQVPSKIISAQLQELEKNNLVEKIKTSTKNNLYIVQERFFNIWYLMRHGDKTAQCKVKWLTRFLEMWYWEENQGMDGFANEYIRKLQTGKFIPSSALTITNALLSSKKISPVSQALVLYATENIVSEEQSGYLPKISTDQVSKALELVSSHDFEGAISILENTTPKSVQILQISGVCFALLEQHEEAIRYLYMIPEKEMDEFSFLMLGKSYFMTGAYDSALKYLQFSLPSMEEYSSLLLGDIYRHFSDYKQALKHYETSWKYHNRDALFRIADVNFVDLGNFEEVIHVLSVGLIVYPQDVKLLSLLGTAYAASNRPVEVTENIMYQLIKLRSEPKDRYFLAKVYFQKNVQKEKSLEIIEGLIKTEDSYNFTSVLVLVWNNRVTHAIEILYKLLDSYKENTNGEFERKTRDLNMVLTLLLSKKQYHIVLNIFLKYKELKDKLKPTYYALMSLLKDEYTDEYLKMGKELEEPVKDILKTVEQYAIAYA